MKISKNVHILNPLRFRESCEALFRGFWSAILDFREFWNALKHHHPFHEFYATLFREFYEILSKGTWGRSNFREFWKEVTLLVYTALIMMIWAVTVEVVVSPEFCDNPFWKSSNLFKLGQRIIILERYHPITVNYVKQGGDNLLFFANHFIWFVYIPKYGSASPVQIISFFEIFQKSTREFAMKYLVSAKNDIFCLQILMCNQHFDYKH